MYLQVSFSVTVDAEIEKLTERQRSTVREVAPPPPTSSTTYPSNPHFNLLANMMFDAIYYIPMIYYIAMPSFE
jgi:hypothetical protein